MHLDSDPTDGQRCRKELKEIIERNKMNWDFIESVEFEEHQGRGLSKDRSRVLELVEK